MPKLAESTTSVIVRGETWQGETNASEPYECGWAREAVLFLRFLKGEGGFCRGEITIEISPDGMHWCREGTAIATPHEIGAVTHAKLAHFGNWLRITGQFPAGASGQLLATLHLKA